MEEDDERYVYWVERRGRGCFLQATPIDVSPILSERLFHKVDSVILTSATLAVAGGFAYTEKRLGLEGARGLVVPSHFDYRKQTLLYVPQHLPEPRNPAFSKAAGQEVVRILELSRGRAFVLFTSYQQMRLVYETGLIRNRVPHAAARHRAQDRAARGVPLDAPRGALCDFLLLAGRGRAGRAVELRYHR
jgi:ATP-dependent DNA helicase DinG